MGLKLESLRLESVGEPVSFRLTRRVCVCVHVQACTALIVHEHET